MQEKCKMSWGADIKASTLLGSRADAHSRVVICVSLSTAAIALPPSTPMLFRLTLRVQAKCNVSWGADMKSEQGWGAPERSQVCLRQNSSDRLAALVLEAVIRDTVRAGKVQNVMGP